MTVWRVGMVASGLAAVAAWVLAILETHMFTIILAVVMTVGAVAGVFSRPDRSTSASEDA